MTCRHHEGKLGSGQLAPPVHDCRYVDERNKLIPIAERVVNERLRAQAQALARESRTEVSDELARLVARDFSRLFLAEMTALWARCGS